jgi:superfamily II DNA or RNA helicase
MNIIVEKQNEATLRITSDDFGIEQELSDFFSFKVPGAQFTPQYKAKIWDGIARLYDIHRKTLPFGLLEYVNKFAENNNYTVTTINIESHEEHSIESIKEFVSSLNIQTRGEKIELRDYQIDALHRAINKGRMLALSPTSSGKSAIIYCYVRWHLKQNRKIVLMVPTTTLVTQMLSDFKDYSSEVEWDAEDDIHCLYSGQAKVFDKPVLITTWQSIHSFSKKKTKEVSDFYKQWDVYIGDEAHRFASNSLLQISNKLVNAKYRLGTTGTIQDAKVQKLTLEGGFGPVYKVITTKELMDAGQVVDLNIKCFILDYDMETKKLLKGADYQKELDYIVTNQKRNNFIAKLSKVSTGNTLILFQFVEKHGKPLFKLIQDMCPDRPLFYISGEVSVEERERIRQVLDTHEDAIIIASFATLSTGVNIPSIENIIFASPSKSKIRNLQSIGRGLRLRKGKNSCNLYDIADNFTIKSKLNHTMKHFKERIDQYQTEQFKFSIKQLQF